MKYFKPELLARCRSLDDDEAEAAADGWERAVTAYNAKLATIRRELPPGVRFILDHFSLHDARLFGITVSRAKPWVSLFVRHDLTLRHPEASSAHAPLRFSSGTRGSLQELGGPQRVAAFGVV